ncbi:MAG: hypothetical protein NTX50_07030 [Candidatus Sumerlaeota bacterium]|nr:hypothetical protein [Candidatus Sumerlaeota bacterium]
MTPLTANLKCYYQCRTLYLWYFIILMTIVYAVAMSFVTFPRGQGANGIGAAYLIVTFLIGFMIASIQREISSRPLSFCLPGHRFVPRRLIFIAGAVVSFAFSFLILARFEKAPEVLIPRFFAQGAMGMIFYLLGVYFVFGFRWAMQLIGFMYFFIIAAVFLDVPVLLENLILYHPFVTMLLCVPVCFLTWNRLGRADLARSSCGQFYFGLGDGFNRSRMERYRKEAFARSLGKGSENASAGERRFLALMLGRPALGAGRFVWGAIYASPLGRFNVKKCLQAALMYLVFCVFFGYWTISNQKFSMQDFTVIILCFLGLGGAGPVLSALLLPAGRRERFAAGVALAYTYLLIAMVLAALMCAVSHGLIRCLPPITLRGMTFSYHAIDPRMLSLPLILSLAFQGFSLFVQRLKSGRQMLAMMLPMGFVFGTWLFWMPYAKSLSMASVAAVILAVHGAFVAYLAYVCFRRDLVSGRAGGR